MAVPMELASPTFDHTRCRTLGRMQNKFAPFCVAQIAGIRTCAARNTFGTPSEHLRNSYGAITYSRQRISRVPRQRQRLHNSESAANRANVAAPCAPLG